MLYTMKELLKVAKENQFAVPAFNICSFDMLKAVMEEVEAQKAPVIIEIHPDEIAYLGDSFVATVRDYALRSQVPVVIHLDRSTNSSVSLVLRRLKSISPRDWLTVLLLLLFLEASSLKSKFIVFKPSLFVFEAVGWMFRADWIGETEGSL